MPRDEEARLVHEAIRRADQAEREYAVAFHMFAEEPLREPVRATRVEGLIEAIHSSHNRAQLELVRWKVGTTTAKRVIEAYDELVGYVATFVRVVQGEPVTFNRRLL